jgi:hypothetical protein
MFGWFRKKVPESDSHTRMQTGQQFLLCLIQPSWTCALSSSDANSPEPTQWSSWRLTGCELCCLCALTLSIVKGKTIVLMTYSVLELTPLDRTLGGLGREHDVFPG